MPTPCIVLIVEDFFADRELYRRSLRADSSFDYELLEVESLGAGLELCRTRAIDVILLDYLLPDGNGLKFLEAIREYIGHPPVVMVTGAGDESIAVQALKLGAEDYLVKEWLTPDKLQLTVRSAVENARLRLQLRQSQENLQESLERERLVHRITLQMRRSLDPTEVLNTAVTEVRQFLLADRAFIYRFNPDFSGKIVVESVAAGWSSAIAAEVEDQYFMETHGEDYRQGRIQVVEDVYSAGLTDCHREMLERFQIRANLVVPIVQGESLQRKTLWGLLVVSQSAIPRQWQPLEIDLTQQLAVQIGIAIDQAELHQQLQTELEQRQTAEAKLRESQRFLERISGAAPGILYLFDLLENRTVYINRQVTELLGYSPEQIQEMGGDVMANLFHPEDFARVPAHQAQFHTAPDDTKFEFEYRMRHANGEWRWFLTHELVYLRTQAGLPQQILGVVQEITARKQAEAALRQSEERFRAIFNTSYQFVGLLSPDGIMLESNQTSLDFAGITRAEAIGRPFWETRWWSRSPQAQAQLREAIARAAQGEFIRYEVEIWGNDDRAINIDFSLKPIHDESGQVVLLIPEGRDISDRIRHERERERIQDELRQSQERLSLTIESTGMVSFDIMLQNGDTVWSEGAYNILGYAPDCITAKQDLWRSRVHPEDLDRVMALMAQSRVQRSIYNPEYRIIRADNGEIRWLKDFGRFIYNDQGEAIRLVGISFDWTERKQVELALIASNDRFELSATALNALIYDWDVQNDFVDRTRGLYEVTGYYPDEALPTTQWWWEQMHPDDRPQQSLTEIETQLTQLDRTVSEYRIRHKQGHYIWVEDSMRILRDESGRVIRAVGCTRDISDRRRMAEALQQNQERLSLAIEGTGLATWDINMATGRAIWSENHFYLFGYEPTDDNEISLDLWRQRVHPDDFYRVIQATEWANESRSLYQNDYRIIRADTGEIRWLQAFGRFLYNSAGEAVRFVGIVLDITDRKSSENRLRDSEQRLQLGIQVAEVALARFDYATNQVRLSPEAAMLYGIPADELGNDLTVTRDRIHATFHPEERQMMEDLIAQVLNPEGSGWFVQDHRVVWPDGQVRWLSVRKQVFFEYSETAVRPNYAILAAIDITARKQSEVEREQLLAEAQTARQEAEAANRSKDEFVAMVAHELRSPLNSILGWAQLLRTSEFDAATEARALETIERNTQAQVQLIEDLLDISRMTRRTLHLNLAPVNLNQVIEAALDVVRPQAQTKQITLTAHMPFTAQVSGDFNRLQQIVLNLLNNAIKFTPQQGRVEVRLIQGQGEREKGQGEISDPSPRLPIPSSPTHVQIQVQDTGKGIAAEFLPRLFESFQQGQQNTSAKDGLGLGLAIVKNLVELHQGMVTATSPGLGQGSTFTVQLPLLDSIELNPVELDSVELNPVEPQEFGEGAIAPVPSTVSSTVPTAQPNSLAGVRILVVDDEPDMVDLITFILESAEAEVQSASSGADALVLLPQFQPDLLVSDLAMPGGNGYDLVQQMRSLPDGQIPAIALTAYASTDYRERSMQAGFQQYLAKPVEPKVLIKTVLAVLSTTTGTSLSD
ncbi:MAG: PAS domain-containing protein [Oculatellaceae cyanobacterium Prado106]|nr:PAS domain-containing protein [Oculatellaceae cyanobacterium Prado106]